MNKLLATASCWFLIVLTLGVASITRAADGYYVDRTQDYWITVPQDGNLDLWTDLCDDTTSAWCAGIVDSALWLYDGQGNFLAYNDDSWTEHTHAYSLASHISINVLAGEYRVRAGVCCGR